MGECEREDSAVFWANVSRLRPMYGYWIIFFEGVDPVWAEHQMKLVALGGRWVSVGNQNLTSRLDD